jgi:CTP synthase (UTP-ammonia lyase)
VLVEYARNVAGIEGAGHAELDPGGETLIVAPLACSLVGETMLVRTVSRTRAAAICGEALTGYHFCSYGLAAGWTPALEAAGLVFSGYADDGTAEIVEVPGHPFFMASLFQPQARPEEASRDYPLHPLLVAFAAAVAQL